jgi:hypothetical protein
MTGVAWHPLMRPWPTDLPAVGSVGLIDWRLLHVNAAQLNPTVKYRIDGLAGGGSGDTIERCWKYCWSIVGKARFDGPSDERQFLELDRLTEIRPGHLRYR